MTTKHETATAWDSSLRTALALAGDLEDALSIFKVDIEGALATANLEAKKSWEELAIFDLREVQALVFKIKSEVK